MDEARTASGTTRAERVLTLNSRRLTATVLRRIARALELPTSAAPDDLRQLIDGALSEREEDPRSVQVAQLENEEGVAIELRNSEGCFLTIPPEVDGSEGPVREATPPILPVIAAEGEEREDPRITELLKEVSRLNAANTALSTEVSGLKEDLKGEKQQRRELWRLNCQQLRELEDLIAEKEGEISRLQARISELGRGTVRDPPAHDSSVREPYTIPRTTIPSISPSPGTAHSTRMGKAPPIDCFDGQTGNIPFEDWLPTLQRAAAWNNWSDDDCLVQLAGHLRKRALQEWNLLTAEERKTFSSATEALQNQLHPTCRVLAAQEFRHAVQRDDEPVAEFIRRLEELYRKAYGRYKMSQETRDTLLFGQLQEGLKYTVMKAPAVSSAQGYHQLCLAARNEERRLIELETVFAPTTAYFPPPPPPPPSMSVMFGNVGSQPRPQTPSNRQQSQADRRCYVCHELGHFARACPKNQRSNAPADPSSSQTGAVSTQQVWTHCQSIPETSQPPSNPIVSGADLVWVQDNGSSCQRAKVLVEGVPAEGIIDITIMGGDLFRKVSAVGRLKRRTFKKVDKVPHTYDRRPFSLDGKMDMHITFSGMTMRSPVYVKHDAPEQLLLSEGVCRQLQIIRYHPDIVMHNTHNRIGRKKRTTTPANTKTTPIPMEQRSAADTVSHSTSSPVDTETLTDSVPSPASSGPDLDLTHSILL